MKMMTAVSVAALAVMACGSSSSQSTTKSSGLSEQERRDLRDPNDPDDPPVSVADDPGAKPFLEACLTVAEAYGRLSCKFAELQDMMTREFCDKALKALTSRARTDDEQEMWEAVQKNLPTLRSCAMDATNCNKLKACTEALPELSS